MKDSDHNLGPLDQADLPKVSISTFKTKQERENRFKSRLRVFAGYLYAVLGDPAISIEEGKGNNLVITQGDLSWKIKVLETGEVQLSGFKSGITQCVGKFKEEGDNDYIITKIADNINLLLQEDIEQNKQEPLEPISFGGSDEEEEYGDDEDFEDEESEDDVGDLEEEDLQPSGEDGDVPPPVDNEPTPPDNVQQAPPPVQGMMPPQPQGMMPGNPPQQLAPNQPMPTSSRRASVRTAASEMSLIAVEMDLIADEAGEDGDPLRALANRLTRLSTKLNASEMQPNRESNSLESSIPSELEEPSRSGTLKMRNRKAGANDLVPSTGTKSNLSLGDINRDFTTKSLPDSGDTPTIDQDQQPVGSGAPATTIPGPPLKDPMSATDVKTPEIRTSAKILLTEAKKLIPHNPALARRLMVMAGKFSRRADNLSTADLHGAGDDPAVDDGQENLGHGTLELFSAEPPKSSQLASKKRKATPTDWNDPSPVAQPTDTVSKGSKGTGGFATESSKPLTDSTEASDVETPKVRVSHNLVDPSGKIRKTASKVELLNLCKKLKTAGKVKSFKNWKIAKVLEKKTRTASSTKELKFPPIWKSMRAAFKNSGNRVWKKGGCRLATSVQDYGQTLSLEANVTDENGIDHPPMVVSFSVLHEAPISNVATIEVDDAMISNTSSQQNLNRESSKKFVANWIKKVQKAAESLIQ
jgi:hypothetical protein